MTLAGRVAGAVAPFHFFIFFLLSHTTRQGGPPYISRALLAPTTSVSLQLPTVFPRNLLASPLHTPIVRRRPLPSWLARSASVSVGGGVSGLSVHPLKWSLGSIYLCLSFSFLPQAGLTGPRDRSLAPSYLVNVQQAGNSFRRVVCLYTRARPVFSLPPASAAAAAASSSDLSSQSLLLPLPACTVVTSPLRPIQRIPLLPLAVRLSRLPSLRPVPRLQASR